MASARRPGSPALARAGSADRPTDSIRSPRGVMFAGGVLPHSLRKPSLAGAVACYACASLSGAVALAGMLEAGSAGICEGNDGPPLAPAPRCDTLTHAGCVRVTIFFSLSLIIFLSCSGCPLALSPVPASPVPLGCELCVAGAWGAPRLLAERAEAPGRLGGRRERKGGGPGAAGGRRGWPRARTRRRAHSEGRGESWAGRLEASGECNGLVRPSAMTH